MAAIYSVYTSPTHPPIPNHLPTLIVTPHGQPSNILYSYLHTNFNLENYLLTPSPQGDLCVAKLFPPRAHNPGAKASASDPGHNSTHGGASSRVVRCEASRNLKWFINNTGVISPIYKLSLPSPDSPDLPLFQISKPNPNAAFWSLFYFAYAGHNIPRNVSSKSPEEKAVWQTLGEGNEDCVEWVVLCAALNLLDDEIIKAAEKNPQLASVPAGSPAPTTNGRPTPVSLRDPGPAPQQQVSQRGPPPGQASIPPPQSRPPQGYPSRAQGPPPPQGYLPGQSNPGQPRQGVPNVGSRVPPPQQTQQASRRF
ncbi:hypothetical protein BJV74DRAFT_802173 [Russula compacta]|nr:hypothetical protein BJV74DRAFT_802173 [Russula compacta]